MEGKKLYDFVGTVIISTEEYRELVDERATFKCEADQWSDKYWAKHSEAVSLARSNSEKQAEIDRFHAFLNGHPSLETAYADFCHGHEEDADA